MCMLFTGLGSGSPSIMVFKGTPIICHDAHQDSISTNNVIQNEFFYMFASSVGHRDCLDPLCKIFSGNDNEVLSIRGGRVNFSY